MDLSQEIEAIVGQPGRQGLVYKAVLPPSYEIAQILCSFVNTSGGFLILGVHESGRSVSVLGLSSDFNSQVGPIVEKAIAMLSPLQAVRHQHVLHKGKQLYVIGAKRSEFPVTIKITEGSQAGVPGWNVLFSWIHISDIHFGHGDAGHGWDQTLVLAELRKDVDVMVKRGVPAPDAILVTGDIGFSGDTKKRPNNQPSQEYADAERFLRELGGSVSLDHQSIFVVPGNHDVQRPVDKENNSVRRLLDSVREGREPLDTVMADKGDRSLLALRQANFLAFATKFAPARLESETSSTEPRLWWSHRRRIRGDLNIRLVGLNTALLAADELDRGRLSVGKAPLAEVLTASPEPNELVVVLGHHPFRGGWLRDEKETDAWVRRHAHVYLSGHVHEADSEDARKGTGDGFVRVTAGASHGDQKEPASHGYNFAAVMRAPNGDLSLRLWPRRWSNKTKAFRDDTDNLPDGDRYAEHTLHRHP